MTLGAQLLRRWREQKHYSAQKAAEVLNVAISQIGKLESGKQLPGYLLALDLETQADIPYGSWKESPLSGETTSAVSSPNRAA